MPEDTNASFAEKNAALRRGTRNRIAKRRPDFVDPFSLRKKRKTKSEGDELLGALSPCSEEGNLKVKPQHVSDSNLTEKKKCSLMGEVGSSAEVVHSLSTSNPKVRLIIRRKPHPHASSKCSPKLLPNDKLGVKLRIRVKPPPSKLDSKMCQASLTFGELQPGLVVQNSNNEVRNREDRHSPRKVLRKSPRKVFAKLKVLLPRKPTEKGSSLDMGKNIPDRPKRKSLESCQKPQIEKSNRKASDTLESPTSHQISMKSSLPIEGGSKCSNETQQCMNAVNQSLPLKLEPAESMKQTNAPDAKKPKNITNAIDYKAKEHTEGNGKVPTSYAKKVRGHLSLNSTSSTRTSKLSTEKIPTTPGLSRKQSVTSTPQVNVKFVFRVESLPIRKRPYMREENGFTSPMLRRSLRNRQRHWSSS